MITLRADNRDLLRNAKGSYLNTNYLSGVSSLVLENGLGFSSSDYIVLGNFGSEQTEIIQVDSITTNTLALKTATKFAHSESTKVTIIKYNQVKFYHTDTATFIGTPSHALNGFIDLQADDFFTKYYDVTNDDGFGWFIFYNSTTAKATQNSNAMPYAGFENNSVKRILDSFFSQLNNKELKLVSNNDAFLWLDEAYSIAINELNLVNKEYMTSDGTDITVTSGTSEYALETYLSNFGDIISVCDGNGDDVPFINLKDVSAWDDNSGNTVHYYLRGNYIGFSPSPSTAATYTVRYQQITSVLTSYYDSITMPKNNFYCLMDFMMSRAAPKLNRGDGSGEYQRFMNGIERMKLTSHKRDNNLDNWGITNASNV